MSLEVLREAISDNPAAAKALAGLEDINQQNVTRIGELEKMSNGHSDELKKAIDRRDGVTAMVRRGLGLDELTEESFNNKLKTFGQSDALTAMEKDYSLFKDTAYKEKQTLIEQLESMKANSSKKDLVHKVMQTGAYGDLSSDLFTDMFTDWVLQGATLDENNEIIFTNNDGTVVRNEQGSVMSLNDRITAIKNDPKQSKIFIEARATGGGASSGAAYSGRAPSSDGLIRTKMSPQQSVDYIKEFGQAAYNKIPMI